MKTLTFLSSILLFTNILFAQCFTGPSIITPGVFATFSATGAQCNQCYDWDSPNGIFENNDDMSSVVKIKWTTAGSYIVTLTKFTEDGCITCNLPIIVRCEPDFNASYVCAPTVSNEHGFVELYGVSQILARIQIYHQLSST